MGYPKRTAIIIYLSVLALLCLGCSRNTFYPASDILVVSVDPASIIPTETTFDAISEGTINLKLLNKIPCSLISYDIAYKTYLGISMDNLSMSNIRTNIPLAAEGEEVRLTLRPYSIQLMELMQNTNSKISPVQATVTMHFKDINKNEITRNATFLLYKNETIE